jgi:hypothetical protein
VGVEDEAHEITRRAVDAVPCLGCGGDVTFIDGAAGRISPVRLEV